ncbi:DNA-binding response regulator [Azospirillum brasilense]|uniref:Response regulator n=1 Tax=Azospirillum brasilense TaxID=192 RepID=A0A0P0EK57_AZOBR|nr:MULTISPECIES: response regulator [Azospirillum]ALJ38341.1 LuxR family transcriptional regulator [Azospirillum brasilense]MDW7554304.1 response regulator [Azospirillum brasilense]MDW7594521.1 response regulator [Azospirillum brasilense]MDW7629375.1 response regulator [Azospirillum brasilense]MDW7629971.1 response regulator [Azospirillum brasilense]
MTQTDKTSTGEPTVFIIDDDEAVRDALSVLVEVAGLSVRTFVNALEFLHRYSPEQPGCVVADLRMPFMDGLELQEELSRRGCGLPVIIITAHGEVSSAVTAFRSGAVDFLEKPFDDGVFLRRVHEALQRDAHQRRDRSAAESALAKLALLSPRERDVAALMVEGCANKAIAIRLGIGVRTVETHRANILSKLDIRTVPELMRLWMHIP